MTRHLPYLPLVFSADATPGSPSALHLQRQEQLPFYLDKRPAPWRK
jgi:hypothetical protein